jgi:alkylhydroperoxidase family enzyme
MQLNGAVKAHDLRRYELATLAAARRLRSSYCALQHGKVLAQQFMSFQDVPDLPEGLDDADRAVMELAEKVVDDATSVTQADVDKLRALGLTDAEIVDVVLAAAARCFFSKTLDALGVVPDASYAELPSEFREALTVGRPIETE